MQWLFLNFGSLRVIPKEYTYIISKTFTYKVLNKEYLRRFGKSSPLFDTSNE